MQLTVFKKIQENSKKVLTVHKKDDNILSVVRQMPNILTHADVAEWQTHKTQNLAGVTSCGFKSHHPH